MGGDRRVRSDEIVPPLRTLVGAPGGKPGVLTVTSVPSKDARIYFNPATNKLCIEYNGVTKTFTPDP